MKFEVEAEFFGSGIRGRLNFVVVAENSEEAKIKANRILSNILDTEYKITKLTPQKRKTPLYFKSKKALQFLLDNGVVYTIRATKRRAGVVFIKERRDGRKIAYASMRYIGEVVLTKPDNEYWVANGVFAIGRLEDFVNLSGFENVEEWLEEVRKLHGGNLPEKMYLYKIKLI